MSTPFPFRFVEVRGVRYLRLDDVAAFLHALGSTEETDVRNRLDEAVRLLKLSDFTKEELALGERMFDQQPESPWTAFCELRELFGSMSLERRQLLYDAVAKKRAANQLDNTTAQKEP